MPRLYWGDIKVAAAAGCHPSSVYRAKQLLEQLHLVAVERTRGGWTHNPSGELVRAATGYEPHADIYALDDQDRQPRTPPADVAQRFRDLHEQWESAGRAEARAGP